MQMLGELLRHIYPKLGKCINICFETVFDCAGRNFKYSVCNGERVQKGIFKGCERSFFFHCNFKQFFFSWRYLNGNAARLKVK